jgi:hypothetical protein
MISDIDTGDTGVSVLTQQVCQSGLHLSIVLSSSALSPLQVSAECPNKAVMQSCSEGERGREVPGGAGLDGLSPALASQYTPPGVLGPTYMQHALTPRGLSRRIVGCSFAAAEG